MNSSISMPVERLRPEPARARRAMLARACALALSACASTPSGEPPSTVDATLDALSVDGDRPPGVELCYTEQNQNHPATREFWRVFNAGDYAARADASELLMRAAEEHPEDSYFAFLQAHVNLWRLAEMQTLGDALVALEALDIAETQFERAYALCPTDHRIPSWLGPIKIRAGQLFGDDARVEEGKRLLEQGIARYPAFVTFSRLLVYSDAPIDSEEFQSSLDAVRITRDLCNDSTDPGCIDSPRVPYNREGGVIYLGDVYAMAQERENALATYMSAKSKPNWATWPYRDVLEERIRTLDARMAAAATASVLDDHETAWTVSNQCALCHQN